MWWSDHIDSAATKDLDLVFAQTPPSSHTRGRGLVPQIQILGLALLSGSTTCHTSDLLPEIMGIVSAYNRQLQGRHNFRHAIANWYNFEHIGKA